MSNVANMNKFSEDIRRAAVAEYEESGFPLSTVAAKYGASRATLQRWLNVYGGSHRRKGAPDKYEKNTIQAAVDDYLAGKGTLRELSAKYNIGNASLLLYHVKKEINKKMKGENKNGKSDEVSSVSE